MSNPIQFKRGNESGIPALNPGEPGFTTDTEKLYVGNSGNKVLGTVANNTLVTNATSSPTASTLVKRDASGRAQVATPSAGNDAATKAYVDTLVASGGSGDFLQSCRLAATTNLDLFEGETIDGVATVTGDAVLVTGQTTASQNGTYIVNNSGTWTRRDTGLTAGVLVPVTEGTTYHDKLFLLTTNDPIVVGTTVLTFLPLVTDIVEGTMIDIVGNVISFDITEAAAGTAVSTDTLLGNQGGTPKQFVISALQQIRGWYPPASHLISVNTAIGWEWQSVSDTLYVEDTYTRRRAAGANLAANDPIYNAVYKARVSGTDTQVAGFTVKYTGNGTTLNSEMDWTLYDSGSPAIPFKLIGNSIYADGATTTDIAIDDKLIVKDTSQNDKLVAIPAYYVNAFVFPGLFRGRLSLSSTLNVTTADVTGAGTLYLHPFDGNRIPIYDGTRWKMLILSSAVNVSLSGLSVDTQHDVFVYDNSGTVALGLEQWTNPTTRATALTTVDGVYVKSGATSNRYVGTIRISAANVCEDSLTKRYVWNYYNQVQRRMRVLDSTAFDYNSATIQQWNANTANKISAVIGVVTDSLTLGFSARYLHTTTVNSTATIGIGHNSTSAYTYALLYRNPAANITYEFGTTKPITPVLGLNDFNLLHNGIATATNTWDEGEVNTVILG